MFIVIELQTTQNDTASIINNYVNRSEAESKYHQILTAAAISSIPIHAAVIMNERGGVEKSEYYLH